jgi:soluble lytic murein transglycosylase-like protein
MNDFGDERPTGEIPRIDPTRGWTLDPGRPSPPPSGYRVPANYQDEGPRYAEYGPSVYQPPPRPWWRGRTLIAVLVAVAVVLGAGTAGWALRGGDDRTTTATNAAGHTPTPTPTVAPTTEPPALTPSPTPPPAPTTTRAPVVVPSQKPPEAELPPPPPPEIPDTPDCVQHPGPDAPPAEVAAALTAAGAVQYWKGVVPPEGLNGPLPVITVPANVMKAVAWAESAWQSTVIACDHGIGLMQVMPGTVDYINLRFEPDYGDVHTVAGNAAYGANYLEWLIMYFGLYYFGSFDLNTVAPKGDGGVNIRLLDVVLAAYNVGHDAVENTHGTRDSKDDTLHIPNTGYVNRVLGYMTNCPCPA